MRRQRTVSKRARPKPTAGGFHRDKTSKVQSFNQGAGRGAACALQFGGVSTPRNVAGAALAVAAADDYPKHKLLFASSTCPDEINCAAAWEPLFHNGVLPACFAARIFLR